MKKIWLLALILAMMLAAAGVAGCNSGATGPIEIEGINISNQQEGIWVSGEGTVTVIPDIATLSLGIEVQAESVSQAREQAAAAMDSVMDALTNNGIAENDIQTQHYSIYPVTRWDPDDDEYIILGYRVTNTVSAKIRDMDDVSRIIDAAIVAGGDYARVSGIYFSIDDPSDYYEEAREEAMADARAKAEQLADLAEVTLGQATYISESSYFPSAIYRGLDSYEEEAIEGIETPISPGETEISLTVQVGYAIQD